MPEQPFRLLALAVSRDDPALDVAFAARVDGVIAPLDGLFADDRDVAEFARRCADEDVLAIVEVEIDRVPADHALVQDAPELFRVPRREANPALMDPNVPAAALDARARLREDVAARLAEPIAERLAALAEQGIAGFRLLGVDSVAPALLATIVERVRAAAPGALFFAGPLAAQSEAGAFVAAGLDWLVTSSGTWNPGDASLVEETQAIRGAVPLLAEVRPEHLAGGDEPMRVARSLVLAAATADGAIVPAAILGDAVLVARLRRIGTRAAAMPGAMRRLTGSGAPVTALLRVDTPDIRDARDALIVLVNRAAEQRPAPDPAMILPAAGVALRGLARIEGRGDPFAPLGGGEVRVIAARRGRPIATAIRSGGKSATAAAHWPRLVVENVEPSVSGGAFAVRRVVGERVEVAAIVFADGHEQLAAEILWRGADEKDWQRVRMAQLPNDRWSGSFVLPRLGRHEYLVEGWLDRFGGYRRDFAKKLDAGVAQAVDHLEGRTLIADAVARGAELGDWPARLAAADDEAESARLLLSPELAAAMDRADDRPHRVRSTPQIVDAERLQARFSSWYELFPRSMSGSKDRHGTLADVIDHLPRIRDMGFDTLYFPPIHPIGTANRKGPNNTLTPAPGDPGSPYAIGSADGGHDAIHPELGSFEDFARLVEAARGHGLEIAIDFAIQCSPDHPWLKDHPGWFAWRPDGSMKYAENPPKKYQDIVNVDFYGPDAVPGLWLALRDVVLLWARHGVKTFRVDNPHTKPLPFWEWMIGEVRQQHPEAIFLAEAFTRPTMMYRLAKVGFSQSYTYFTWRDTKHELIEYITELTTEAPKEFYRPHFFVNTPDINPPYLQTSGRPGFRIRAVLAATLSGLFGVYSGFELCESAALPGREEYLDSEKYELRPRDWAAPGNIIADIAALNRLRRAHPALQTHLNTRFYPAWNDQVIYYGKPEPDGEGIILVMVNLDPHTAQTTGFEVPLWDLGLPDDGVVAVEDLVGGWRFDWYGKGQTITLDPDEPYRIWRIARTGGTA